MKVFLALILLSTVSFAASTSSKRTLPVNKNEQKIKEIKEAAAKGAKEEDCDDKAKKPIEITPDSISLTGNTGCSLDEAH